MIQHLDGISDEAAMMGAVNTIVRKGDQLIGDNTDGKGFVQSLKEVADPQGKKIVMFGAGGAARAIGVETALEGAAEITIVNRSAERGEELARLLKEKTDVSVSFALWDGEYTLADDVDVVINATSIGLFPDVDAVFPLDFFFLKTKHGGSGRDSQSTANLPAPRSRQSRLPYPGWPGHAREPGRDRLPTLDRRRS